MEPPKAPPSHSKHAEDPPSLTRNSDKASDSVPLPSWLTQNVPPEDTESKSYVEGAKSTMPGPSKAHRTEPKTDVAPGLFTKLEQGSNCEDNKRSSERLVSIASLEHSQLAFRDLVQQDTPMDMVISFLENPRLNALEAQNLQYLLTAQSQRTISDPTETETLCRWLGKQVALGLLPHDEILSILEIIVRNSGEKSTTASYEGLYRAVFEGISTSTVYTGANDPRILSFNAFLISTPAGALSWAAQNLGVEIIRTFRITDETPLKTSLRLFLKSWYSSEDTDHNGEDLALALRSRATKILDMLQHMPHDWLVLLIREKNRKFFRRLFAMDEGGTVFLHQLSSLGESSFLIGLLPYFEAALAQEKPAVLAKYLRLMDHRAKCVFLLRHWYEAELGHRLTVGPSFPSGLEARFEGLTQEHPKRSPFINLLSTLRACDYYPPATSQNRLLRLLHALDMSGTILALIAFPLLTGVPFGAGVVKAEILYHLSIGKQRIAYKIFQSYHRLSMEHVPELAEVIISRPNLQVDTALRYRRRRRKWLDRTEQFQQDPSIRETLRTDTLNRMALAYAKSPHLLPRQAFREVYDCYLALKRERLPLTPDLTKALTHAGVVRFLQAGQWVSTARFTWSLGLVRQIEGQEVADKLDKLVWDWRGELIDQRRRQGEKERRERVRLEYPRPTRRFRMVLASRGRASRFKWSKCDGE